MGMRPVPGLLYSSPVPWSGAAASARDSGRQRCRQRGHCHSDGLFLTTADHQQNHSLLDQTPENGANRLLDIRIAKIEVGVSATAVIFKELADELEMRPKQSCWVGMSSRTDTEGPWFTIHLSVALAVNRRGSPKTESVIDAATPALDQAAASRQED